MADKPQPYAQDTAPPILALADWLGDPVAPAKFPQTKLRWRNDRAAAGVALDQLSDGDWLAHFGRFEPLPGNLERPLALRYHGHQFRMYNPEIGDGRGFLYAQLRAADGRLMDLGTKGSGQTPYSRTADGRLTLKGAVRELLATEMLEALGVDTSKTFSIVETGEELMRVSAIIKAFSARQVPYLTNGLRSPSESSPNPSNVHSAWMLPLGETGTFLMRNPGDVSDLRLNSTSVAFRSMSRR